MAWQQNDAKPDEHTEATEVAPSRGGDGQGDDDLQEATPQRLFGVEMPEGDVASSQEDGHVQSGTRGS